MFASRKSPSGVLNWRVGRDHLQSPEQRQGEIDAYDGAIAYVDTHINQLLAELQKRHLDANTLVVITSDHGEAFGEHGSYLHGNSLYREEAHVPLIFWWPGRVRGLLMEHPVTDHAPRHRDGPSWYAYPDVISWTIAGQTLESTQPYLNWSYPLTEIEQIPWGRKEVRHLTAL